MSNYLPAQNYQWGKFDLELHPYIAVPENVFERGAALQYGADFKTRFSRRAPQANEIGLMQLIFPQTAMFPQTQVGAWNVDKRAPNDSHFPMVRCLYSEDGVVVGPHSEFYQGQPTRELGTTTCWLIDTPREFNNDFATGRFEGTTNTKFANYVVDLVTGKVFDQGVLWGYRVQQDPVDLNVFTMAVQAPGNTVLSQNGEHRNAIARFLGMEPAEIAAMIA